MKKRVQEWLRDKTRLLTCLTLLFSLAGYLGRAHRLLELTSHFKAQYLAVSLCCLVALLLWRDRRWSLVALLSTVINSAAILPWYWGKSAAPSGAQANHVRLLLSNVLTSNQQSARLIELVHSEQPDVLILQEVNGRWMQALKPLDDSFPYAKAIPRDDNFGIAVLSRLPLRAREMTLGNSGVPSIVADLKIAGRDISLIATHPLPPGSQETFEQRNAQLASLASLARHSAAPIILVGDLNVTMWSPFYAALIRDSGLVNARKGFGVLPTWPAQLPLWRIPLDHCLTSADIKVADIRVGQAIGSDHLPLIVELALP